MTPDYLMVFMTGLLGGVGHCIGMCGPVVASYSIHCARVGSAPGIKSTSGSPARLGLPPTAPHFLYNLGRITTYGAVGAAMGLGGSFAGTVAKIEGAQQFTTVMAGIIMAVMGMAIVSGRNPARLIEQKGGAVLRGARVVLESDSSVLKFFPLGLLMGLLPCGLSYSIFIGSAATGGLLEGSAFAVVFGLGTLPALFFFSLLVSYLGSRVRGLIFRLGGALVAAMGVLYIFRGLAGYARM